MLAIGLAWGLAILAVDPRGNFPLNDDFSFGKSVYNLCVEGRVFLDEWLAMTFATQWLWGSACCELFGFSFTVLRLSTLVLATVAVAMLYQSLRRGGQPSTTAALLALVLAFNPLFFSLAFTFMTDVPFVALMLLSLWGWWRWLERPVPRAFALALGLSLLTLMLRQVGLMLLLAPVVGRWHQTRRLAPSLLATWPALMGMALLAAWTHWLDWHQGLPETWQDPLTLVEKATTIDSWLTATKRIAALAGTLGLFLLPALVGLRSWRWVLGVRRHWLYLLAGVLLLANGLWWRETIPWGNVFYNLGLGPKLLKDGQYFLNVRPSLGAPALAVLQVVAAFAGAWLGVVTLALVRRWVSAPFTTYLTACAGAYFIFVMLDTYSFDRYWLVFVPLLLLLLAWGYKASTGQRPPWLAWGLVALMGLFSVGATHDYLAWNRARWEALHWLTNTQGVPPERIDGGFEFNGWHRPGVLEHGRARSWWWVAAEDYCITFGELEGFTKVQAFTWPRWLPPGRDSLLVIHKDGTPW